MEFFKKRSNKYRVHMTDALETPTEVKRIKHNASPQSVAEPSLGFTGYGVLDKRSAVEWRVKMGDGRVKLPEGPYDFVRMLDGEVRVAELITENTSVAHTLLYCARPQTAVFLNRQLC